MTTVETALRQVWSGLGEELNVVPWVGADGLPTRRCLSALMPEILPSGSAARNIPGAEALVNREVAWVKDIAKWGRFLPPAAEHELHARFVGAAPALRSMATMWAWIIETGPIPSRNQEKFMKLALRAGRVAALHGESRAKEGAAAELDRLRASPTSTDRYVRILEEDGRGARLEAELAAHAASLDRIEYPDDDLWRSVIELLGRGAVVEVPTSVDLRRIHLGAALLRLSDARPTPPPTLGTGALRSPIPPALDRTVLERLLPFLGSGRNAGEVADPPQVVLERAVARATEPLGLARPRARLVLLEVWDALRRLDAVSGRTEPGGNQAVVEALAGASGIARRRTVATRSRAQSDPRGSRTGSDGSTPTVYAVDSMDVDDQTAHARRDAIRARLASFEDDVMAALWVRLHNDEVADRESNGAVELCLDVGAKVAKAYATSSGTRSRAAWTTDEGVQRALRSVVQDFLSQEDQEDVVWAAGHRDDVEAWDRASRLFIAAANRARRADPSLPLVRLRDLAIAMRSHGNG